MHWTAVMKQVVEPSEAIQDMYHDYQRESRVVEGRGEYATTCALLRVCSSSLVQWGDCSGLRAGLR